MKSRITEHDLALTALAAPLVVGLLCAPRPMPYRDAENDLRTHGFSTPIDLMVFTWTIQSDNTT